MGIRRIIGAAFGEGDGFVEVVMEDRDSYHYAKVRSHGRVELRQGSFFSKADFYGSDPRFFLGILGKFAPEVQELREFIHFTGEWAISQADADNLFRWDREAHEILSRGKP